MTDPPILLVEDEPLLARNIRTGRASRPPIDVRSYSFNRANESSVVIAEEMLAPKPERSHCAAQRPHRVQAMAAE
jgi:hypothetical protein